MKHHHDHASSAAVINRHPDSDDHELPLEKEHAVPHWEVAALAYEIWQQAGCPENTHEQDWLAAERQLTNGGRHSNTVGQAHAVHANAATS